MTERFTLRLIPQPGESLSSFIMRSAKANEYPMKYIKRYIAELECKYPHTENLANIDICPLNNKTYEFLNLITGVDISVLKNMTFTSVYAKFLTYVDDKANSKCQIGKSIYIKDRRRFCPDCISENGAYKLIWQLYDINICNIHLTKLTSKCYNCGVEQPYALNDIDIYKCYNCGADLRKNSEYINEEKQMNDQINKYRNWSYLLNGNTILVNKINNFSIEKSLAITFLYILQDGKDKFNSYSWSNYCDRKQVYRISNLILDKPQGKCIKMDDLLNLLNEVDKCIDEFSKVVVPIQFVESIYNYYNKIEPGDCRTPWCPYMGSNREMKRIEHYGYDFSSYSEKYFCGGCHITYGYNRENNIWEPVDNFMYIVSQVLPLLMIGTPKSKIKLDVCDRTIDKAIGYIASHMVIPPEIFKKYAPHYIPNDVLERFKMLLNTKGRMESLAKKLFNWNRNDFYYFIMLDEVQEFLIYNSYKTIRRRYKLEAELSKKVKAGIDKVIDDNHVLSIKNVAKEIGVSIKKLKQLNLDKCILDEKIKRGKLEVISIQNKIDEYLQNSELKGIRVTIKDIYKFLGISSKKFYNFDHDLLDWIKKRCHDYNIKFKAQTTNAQIVQIENAIKKFHSIGKTVVIKDILIEAGIGRKIFYKKKELRKVVEDQIKGITYE